MNETTSKNSLVVKILVIIGFIATIWLILWAGGMAIQKLFPTFENMASVAEFKDTYKPVDILEIEVEKNVINSGESFEIYWTDMKQTGEFKFTYECEDGVTMLIRGERGQLLPMQCTDTFTLPATVHGLFLAVDSVDSRFIDVDFAIAFVSAQKEITHIADAKVTVVNALVSAEQEIAGESIEEQPEEDAESETPQTPAVPVFTYTSTYPQSNPNGYTDLSVSILGIGEVTRSGAFKFTDAIDPDDRHAVKFDVQNTGTRISGTWEFEVQLPDGSRYQSGSQAPLKPKEHAVMVLQFNTDEDDIDDDFVEIEVEITTNRDSVSNNNDATWSIPVED